MLLNRLKSWLSGSTSSPSNDRRQGRVIYFNRRKGYGFIKMTSSDEDIFMHVSELEGNVRKGDQVSFDIEQESRGPKAVAVEVLP